MAQDNPSYQRTTIVQFQKKTLKRVLGVFDLFAIGYADLGSSMFYALGVTAFFSLGATPISLGLASIVFICTALTYAEMSSIFHEAGGSASFARHAFNDLISFIAGWGLLLDYIVTIAISSFAVGPYLSYFFEPLKIPHTQILFAIVLICVLFFMNMTGAKQSTRTSLILTVFALLIQTIIIAIGFDTIVNITDVVAKIKINVPNVDWSPTWSEFWQGTAMAMVAYTGIESITQLGAESHKPAKTVPRAILLTMGVLIVMYVGIVLVALSAVPAKELGTRYILNPIEAIVDFLPYGRGLLSPCIAILAAVILSVAANAGMMGSSRLSFNMGEFYQLPRVFHRLHKRFRTPVISLAFFSITACLIIILSNGKIDFLADLYNFGAMIAFFSAHIALIVLRIKKPNMKRPFRIGLNIPFGKAHIPISAIIGAFATFSVWCLVVFTKPDGRYLGTAWMLIGIAMYAYYRKSKKIEAIGSIKLQNVKIQGYRLIEIHQILVPTSGIQTETIQIACELAKTYHAKITALQVIDLADSLPLDSKLHHRTATTEAILKNAEAIAREFNVEIELKIIQSRSIVDSILQEAKKGKYDLIILGSQSSKEVSQKKHLSAIAETVLKKAKCRVWIC